MAVNVGNGRKRRPSLGARLRCRQYLKSRSLPRRGLLAVALVLIGLVAGWILAASSGQALAASDTGERARGLSLRIVRGDTLWGISRRVYPDADPRDGVSRIRAANGLSGDHLMVGQALDIPAS